jgi:flagellar hook-associated protein 1 FlgK
LADVSNPTNPAQVTQKISLSGTDDVAIGLFDKTGTQVSTTTLRTILQSANYNDAAGNATSLDIGQVPAVAPTPPATVGVSMVDLAAKIQNWMQTQSYQGNTLTGATASVATGKLALNTGDTSVSLVFRDQTATAEGSPTTDARVNFDVDGDGTADQTVQGFSNFFGLNDFFTSKADNFVADSEIQRASFTTTTSRTISLLDPTGQIGNAVTIPSGSSMNNIAALINAQTQTNESAVLSSSSISVSSAATFTFTGPNGTMTPSVTIPSGPTPFPATLTLGGGAVAANDIATQINNAFLPGQAVQAKMVQVGNNYQLRVWGNGVPLDISITGGTINGTTNSLEGVLNLQQAHLVNAAVVPEGSGYRLRIQQTNGKELYVGAQQDALKRSLITDLGLRTAAADTAGNIDVRTDIKASPNLVSRGSMKYNSDIKQYYMSEGDNTTALQLSTVMQTKTTMAGAGDIASGSYTVAEYAAATISVVARNSAESKSQQAYQSTLGQSLQSQYSNQSGVNLDEEVSNMLNFQQAYSASAKVISTLQEMLDVLMNTVK